MYKMVFQAEYIIGTIYVPTLDQGKKKWELCILMYSSW